MNNWTKEEDLVLLKILVEQSKTANGQLNIKGVAEQYHQSGASQRSSSAIMMRMYHVKKRIFKDASFLEDNIPISEDLKEKMERALGQKFKLGKKIWTNEEDTLLLKFVAQESRNANALLNSQKLADDYYNTLLVKNRSVSAIRQRIIGMRKQIFDVLKDNELISEDEKRAIVIGLGPQPQQTKQNVSTKRKATEQDLESDSDEENFAQQTSKRRARDDTADFDYFSRRSFASSNDARQSTPQTPHERSRIRHPTHRQASVGSEALELDPIQESPRATLGSQDLRSGTRSHQPGTSSQQRSEEDILPHAQNIIPSSPQRHREQNSRHREQNSRQGSSRALLVSEDLATSHVNNYDQQGDHAPHQHHHHEHQVQHSTTAQAHQQGQKMPPQAFHGGQTANEEPEAQQQYRDSSPMEAALPHAQYQRAQAPIRQQDAHPNALQPAHTPETQLQLPPQQARQGSSRALLASEDLATSHVDYYDQQTGQHAPQQHLHRGHQANQQDWDMEQMSPQASFRNMQHEPNDDSWSTQDFHGGQPTALLADPRAWSPLGSSTASQHSQYQRASSQNSAQASVRQQDVQPNALKQAHKPGAQLQLPQESLLDQEQPVADVKAEVQEDLDVKPHYQPLTHSYAQNMIPQHHREQHPPQGSSRAEDTPPLQADYYDHGHALQHHHLRGHQVQRPTAGYAHQQDQLMAPQAFHGEQTANVEPEAQQQYRDPSPMGAALPHSLYQRAQAPIRQQDVQPNFLQPAPTPGAPLQLPQESLLDQEQPVADVKEEVQENLDIPPHYQPTPQQHASEDIPPPHGSYYDHQAGHAPQHHHLRGHQVQRLTQAHQQDQLMPPPAFHLGQDDEWQPPVHRQYQGSQPMGAQSAAPSHAQYQRAQAPIRQQDVQPNFLQPAPTPGAQLELPPQQAPPLHQQQPVDDVKTEVVYEYFPAQEPSCDDFLFVFRGVVKHLDLDCLEETLIKIDSVRKDIKNKGENPTICVEHVVGQVRSGLYNLDKDSTLNPAGNVVYREARTFLMALGVMLSTLDNLMFKGLEKEVKKAIGNLKDRKKMCPISTIRMIVESICGTATPRAD